MFKSRQEKSVALRDWRGAVAAISIVAFSATSTFANSVSTPLYPTSVSRVENINPLPPAGASQTISKRLLVAETCKEEIEEICKEVIEEICKYIQVKVECTVQITVGGKQETVCPPPKEERKCEQVPKKKCTQERRQKCN